MDSRAFEIALANYQGESVRELEQMCSKSLRRYMPLMSTMCREGQLLPLKFDQRFYEWSFTCNKNSSCRSHHVLKSQWPIIKIDNVPISKAKQKRCIRQGFLTDTWPTNYWHTANSRPTKGQQLTDCWQKMFVKGGKWQSADSFLGELFFTFS